MKAEYDFSRGRRGAVDPLPHGKTRITIRIDEDILDWFRSLVHAAGGGNYQTLINDALRQHMERQAEPLEETLRRVLREELPRHREAKKLAQGVKPTPRPRKDLQRPSGAGRVADEARAARRAGRR
jgi:hypothetical protein